MPAALVAGVHTALWQRGGKLDAWPMTITGQQASQTEMFECTLGRTFNQSINLYIYIYIHIFLLLLAAR